MVADLVGDHVGLRELAARPELAAELVEEAEVDVHPLVGRGSKRAPSAAWPKPHPVCVASVKRTSFAWR